jgi:small subunit ribosomal protein S20
LTSLARFRKLKVRMGCVFLALPSTSQKAKGLPKMANHVSALKRVRQTDKRTTANRANKSRVRKSLRALREALAQGNAAAAAEQYRNTVSALDKSVQKGMLHSNTASRYKSRLNARVKALSAKA